MAAARVCVQDTCDTGTAYSSHGKQGPTGPGCVSVPKTPFWQRAKQVAEALNEWLDVLDKLGRLAGN